MKPELFIKQQEVPGFLGALICFANTFPVAEDRRNILTGGGIEASFFGNLRLDAIPITFANNLLAKFREYRVSNGRVDYHPLVIFLDYVLSTGPENYGFNEQQIALCTVILKRGKKNVSDHRVNALKINGFISQVSPIDCVKYLIFQDFRFLP